jgi:hypothetical protein
VGPGARTLFDFSPIIAAAALTTIKTSLTTEADGYEPNNVREDAAAIQPGREISAQFLVPYVSTDEQAAVDWYKLDLAPGTHVFKLTSVPEDLFIDVDITDSARVAIDSGRAPNTGATFQFSFEVAKAGSYVFNVTNVVSVPVLITGAKRHFLSESYKFQID